MVSEEKLDELGREYNFHAERAAVLFLDGYDDEAPTAADQAVTAISRLHKYRPHDKDYTEAYACASRDRAEIATLRARADSHDARRLYTLGAKDAAKAIELFEQDDTGKYPTRIASVRINLAELLAGLGRMQEARAQSEAALAVYRQHLSTEEDSPATQLARALERCADLLGVAPEAHELRMSAVKLYRPFTKPGSRLWSDRHSRGNDWLSVATLARFGATSLRLAAAFPRPSGEAVQCLFDAAEIEVALVVQWRLPVNPADALHLRKAKVILERLAGHLHGTAPELAARCESTIPVLAIGTNWLPVVSALRPEVEAAARQLPG